MSDIIIVSQPEGSGSGTGTTETTVVETSPNVVDVDSLILIPLEDTVPEEGDILVYNGEFYIPQDMLMSLNQDVDIEDAEDKDLLSYNSSTSKWESKSVDDLLRSDLQFDSILNPEVEDLLSYNGTNWVPVSRDSVFGTFSLTNLEDVEISTELESQVLRYDPDNSTWSNSTLSLSDLSNVEISNLQDLQVLTYSSTEGKFINSLLNVTKFENLDLTNITEESVIKYNPGTGEFEMVSYDTVKQDLLNTFKVGDIKDINLEDLVEGNVLSYDSNSDTWISRDLDYTDLKSYSQLTEPLNWDVQLYNKAEGKWKPTSLTPQTVFRYNLTELGNNKALVYNTSTSKWEPRYITLDTVLESSNIPNSILEKGSSIVYDTDSLSWTIKKITLDDIVPVDGTDFEVINVFNIEDGKWEIRDISAITSTLSGELNTLTDVEIEGSSLLDKQVLSYNSTTEVWSARTLTLRNLEDVNLSSLATGHFLTYNAASSKWEAGTIDFTTLLDNNLVKEDIVDKSTIVWNSTTLSWEVRLKSLEEVIGLTGVNNEGVLYYNNDNSKWEVESFSTLLGLLNTLEGLSDINIENIAEGDLLSYNSLTGKWINKEPELNYLKDVDLSNLSNSNILKWNSLLAVWEPIDLADFIQSLFEQQSFNSLSDVDVDTSDPKLVMWEEEEGLWKSSFLIPSNLNLEEEEWATGKELLSWDKDLSSWTVKMFTLSDILNIDETSLTNDSVALFSVADQEWKILGAYELNEYIAKEIDLGELKNIEAPNKLHNQVLTWDSAIYKWTAKSLDEIGAIISGTIHIEGNDWVALFESGLN